METLLVMMLRTLESLLYGLMWFLAESSRLCKSRSIETSNLTIWRKRLLNIYRSSVLTTIDGVNGIATRYEWWSPGCDYLGPLLCIGFCNTSLQTNGLKQQTLILPKFQVQASNLSTKVMDGHAIPPLKAGGTPAFQPLPPSSGSAFWPHQQFAASGACFCEQCH